MFVKNDSSAEKRYYNGKIGRITAISADNILVRCGDEKDAITVTREEWTNTKYSINAETQEISETVAGSFKQYPLKTAWAITIHKSQGLTFEKAIVNAGAAFTHGQVYVALSRCKSLEGLVLGTPLRPEALINDQVVKHFTDEVSRNQPGPMQLEDARRAYYLQLLKELFDYSGVLKRLQHVAWVFGEHLWKLYPELTKRCREIRELCHSELTEVGEKFQMQLERLVEGAANYETDRQVGERIAKGVVYFSEQTGRHIVAFLESAQPEIDNKDVRKIVGEALEKLRQEVGVKMETLEAVKEGFEVKAYCGRSRRLYWKNRNPGPGRPPKKWRSEKMFCIRNYIMPCVCGGRRKRCVWDCRPIPFCSRKLCWGWPTRCRQQGKNYWLYRGSEKKLRSGMGLPCWKW